MQLPEIQLDYGVPEPFRLVFDADRFRSFHAGPKCLPDVAASIQQSLNEPCDFPPLSAMCVPGDHPILVLDRGVPEAETILSQMIPLICAAGVEPAHITILQPAHWHQQDLRDPRNLLPGNLKTEVLWKIHDPTIAESTGYLATSVGGERIYLARELLDADLVIPILTAGFDSVLGYRHPGNVLFPGLSNVEAFTKSLGEGHRELRPVDDRPLRQLGEEICWLLGIQFAVEVVPGNSSGGIAQVLAGLWESVQRRSQQFVEHAWKVSLEQRAETVVISVTGTESRVTWEDLGAALDVAQKLVHREGRIIVLSSLATTPGPGLDILRSSRSAKSALQRMRKELPPDLVSSTQIASAISWAKVSLLSRLETSLVEDLLMTPLTSLTEAERLIGLSDDIVFINAGQHTSGEIIAE